MAQPHRFSAYAASAIEMERAKTFEMRDETFGMESSFVISTLNPMSLEEVSQRMRDVVGTLEGPIATSEVMLEAVGFDDEAEDGRDVDFFVDFAFDQTSDLTEHGFAAIEFAEWLEESQPWIKTAYADVMWLGVEPEAGDLAALATRGGLCSEGLIPFNDPSFDRQWAYKRVRAAEAHAYSKQQGRPWGGEGIRIGHIDTGYKAHRELDQNACLPHDGFDFFLNRAPGLDDGQGPHWGHGDSTGSVMVSRSSHIVNGVAPQAQTVPYRATKSVVIGFGKRVSKAIWRAVLDGRPVLSMSLGTLSCFPVLHKAVRKALMSDVITVAAAGNCVGFLVAPAKCDGAVAVSGIGPQDEPWQHASRDRRGRIDISAPGKWVVAASHKNPTHDELSRRGEGTSYATAITAGAAAVWLAHFGRDECIRAARASGMWLNQYFQWQLRATARVPQGWDKRFGAGVLDVEALLKAGLPVVLPDQRDRLSALQALTEIEEPTARALFARAVAWSKGDRF